MRILIITALLILSGCSSAHLSSPKINYDSANKPFPSIESFPHCRSYGCAKTDISHLKQKDISNLKNIFKTNNKKEKEIQNIKKSIAYFETIVGKQTGTSEDVAGTYKKFGHLQLDCIDESMNTTTYLLLLKQLDLLKFYDVNAIASRPPILSGRLGPHRTAVIFDKETQEKLAVDSWFHDNGVEPEITALEKWRWGWHPD